MNCYQIFDLIGGELYHPCDDDIFTGVDLVQKATAKDVVFLFETPSVLPKTNAKLIVSTQRLESFPFCQIIHQQPRLAMAKVMQVFYSHSFPCSDSSIAKSAQVSMEGCSSPIRVDAFSVISKGSFIGKNTTISSNVVIGQHCHIGEGCYIHPNVTIYDHCRIGDRTIIHANTVIGSDGFGYEFDKTHWQKIPQVGGVQIGHDVELGSMVTVNSGCLQPTIIEDGVKIDDHVHVSHNCLIGAHTIIAGGVLIGGSTTIGQYSVIAGGAMIAEQLSIGDHCKVLARSGVTKNIPNHATVSGYPAQDHQKELKFQAYFKRLFRLNN